MTLYKTRTIILAESEDDLDQMPASDICRAEIIVVRTTEGYCLKKPKRGAAFQVYESVLEAIDAALQGKTT